MEFNGSIEYIPDESGTATSVKCPLVNEFISPIDCMENQEVAPSFIPAQYKQKPNWQEICRKCPFRNY